MKEQPNKTHPDGSNDLQQLLEAAAQAIGSTLGTLATKAGIAKAPADQTSKAIPNEPATVTRNAKTQRNGAKTKMAGTHKRRSNKARG